MNNLLFFSVFLHRKRGDLAIANCNWLCFSKSALPFYPFLLLFNNPFTSFIIMLLQVPLLGIIGMQEILIIAIVVLVLFGGKKIPELMRGLGSGVKSFKEGMKEGMPEDDDAKKDTQQKTETKEDDK